ncbi:MAG: hypothetical protein ACLGXA_15210 [Acidobacteriota bacterium]
MKIPVLLLAPVLAFTLAAHAAAPAPAASGQSGVQVCAAATDPENLCRWDAPHGTHGRKCVFDVEKMSRKDVCAYDKATTAEMTDHKPMCISAAAAEHIVFLSSYGREFRVRRLVPINKTNAAGGVCPAHPFMREFHERDFTFGANFDTTEAKASAAGCRYKLEVQFMSVDPNAPIATHDPQHRRLECRDPHLQIVGQ